MICRKCHQTMMGPRWYEPTNTLTYACSCGFKESVPAMDSRSLSAEEIVRLLKKPGLPSSVFKKETP